MKGGNLILSCLLMTVLIFEINSTCSITYNELSTSEKKMVDRYLNEGMVKFNQKINSMYLYKVAQVKRIHKNRVKEAEFDILVKLLPTTCRKTDDPHPRVSKNVFFLPIISSIVTKITKDFRKLV